MRASVLRHRNASAEPGYSLSWPCSGLPRKSSGLACSSFRHRVVFALFVRSAESLASALPSTWLTSSGRPARRAVTGSGSSLRSSRRSPARALQKTEGLRRASRGRRRASNRTRFATSPGPPKRCTYEKRSLRPNPPMVCPSSGSSVSPGCAPIASRSFFSSRSMARLPRTGSKAAGSRKMSMSSESL